MDFLVDHAQTLVRSAREVNQLASVAAVGVQSLALDGSARPKGGVKQRYEEAVAEIQGRIYHFDLLKGGMRSHPLLGCAQSYLFVESTIGQSKRFTKCVAAAALDLRKILRECNPIILRLRRIINFDYLDKCYDEIVRSSSTQVEFQSSFNNSATAQGQLLLLFSVRGSPFECPNVRARILGCPSLSMPIQIEYSSREYESAAYPLLDPECVSGWFDQANEVFTDSAGNELNLRQYTRYKLCQSRYLQMIPRLQQEWILDMMSRVEHLTQPGKSSFMSTLRIATESQLCRAQNPHDLSQVGRGWSIPASVRGSFAYRREKVEMGMAQIHHSGCPTVFITITANPGWIEIVSNLLPGQEWYHDIHLVCMVFQSKLETFLQDLLDGRFFNGRKAVYYQYTIEFQKRGLPHAHILVRLEGQQPETSSQAESLTTCKLPQACDAGCKRCRKCRLAAAVRKHMFHKCYEDRCFKNGNSACIYGYPFKPLSETVMGEDGFWLFERNENESLVVPYNPEMLLRYDCHINTLIAAGSRCVMYLRKYLSKSPDCASARLIRQADSANDALDAFYSSRCLSACEAMWSALGFAFNGFYPSVLPIKIYLPNQRKFVFHASDDLEDIEPSMAKKTDLELYFARPAPLEHLLFQDYFAMHKPTQESSKPRVRQTVPYVANLNFHDKEQFALYCILRVRPGRSFADLRSGQESFEQAAVALGVFQGMHSSMNRQVLSEFSERSLPPEQFQQFLAGILITDINQFSSLFEDFWEHAVPFRHILTPYSALAAIASILYKDCVDVHGLLAQCSPFILDLLPSLVEPDPRDFFAVVGAHPNDSPVRLSDEQVVVADSILRSIETGNRFIYLNGLAGTGKTTVLRHLVAELKHRRLDCVCSAFTGSAALLLPSGLTCHRLFGLPADDDLTNKSSTIRAGSMASKVLRSLQVVIIDEISMLHNQFISIINSTLQAANESSELFGGKTLILSGDLHQLAPVAKASRDAQRGATIGASIASSPVFDTFVKFSLVSPMRFVDPEWVTYTANVAKGYGDVDPNTDGLSLVRIPDYVTHSSGLTDAHIASFHVPSHLQMISPLMATVAKWNAVQFHRFYGSSTTTRTYEAYYTYPPEYRVTVNDAHAFDKSGIASHLLTLAVGCPVIMMRNVIIWQGFANGTQAVVESLDGNSVTIKTRNGKTYVAHRITFPIIVNNMIVHRHQFPLCVGFASTISKSQGRTCDHLVIDLTTPVFTHGQLYVALTRCRSPSDIHVISESRDVTNVVFQEIIFSLR